MSDGKCWKFGDNIDTDAIIPARYLNTTDPAQLAAHCMEDADAGFAKKAAPGDVIIGGENFGCGSSREHAPIAIKAAGISFVVAKSFARIFFRNAINIGLAIFECPEAAEEIPEGHKIAADIKTGVIIDLTSGKRYQAAPFAPAMQEIIAAGGLMNFVKSKVTA